MNLMNNTSKWYICDYVGLVPDKQQDKLPNTGLWPSFDSL